MTLLKTKSQEEKIQVLENLIALSVDLHNLNARMQRRWELSIVQWLVLKKIVDRPGLSAGTIADISKVHPSTLTPTIGRLEALGLIYILERPTDHRRKLLVASWKGLEWSQRSEIALIAALERSVDCRETAKIEVDKIRSLTTSVIKSITI